MLLNDAMMERQREQAQASLRTAVVTARWTAAVIIGACVALYAVNRTAEATLKAAQMQIEAQMEFARHEATRENRPIHVAVQPSDPKSE